MARWRSGEVGRWRGGEVARWRVGEVERWRGGEDAEKQINTKDKEGRNR